MEPSSNIKILIVDDFIGMRKILRDLLTTLGYANIHEADDGKTALPRLQAEPFDFLITDLNMPGMPGLELVQTLRADEALNHLPVLMVTSEARRPQILSAASAGVDGYLVKPFTAESLQRKIQAIYGGHR